MIEKNKRTKNAAGSKNPKEGLIQEVEKSYNNFEPRGQDQEYYDVDGNFMWDEYEASCVSQIRKPNPHIKTKHGEKVYSRGSYVQGLYNALEGFEANQEFKPKINIGEIYDGIVHATTLETISIDIGYRELVYVYANKEPEEYRRLRVGEETSVLITNTDNSYVSGSISGGVKQKIFMDLRNGIETEDTAWVGKVSHMIENGGYIVNIQGIDCFMPGSLAGISKLADFK